MDIKDTIDKFKDRETILLLFGILFLVTPGILDFFVYYRDIFIDASVVKLILLSISLTLPASFVYTIVLFEGSNIKDGSNESNELFVSFVVASIFSGLAHYCAAFLAYPKLRSFKEFLLTLFVIQVLTLILVVWTKNTSKKKY